MTARYKAKSARRPRGQRGETITEVLVAILISGLAILMLAVVMASVSNMSKVSETAMQEYFSDNNDMVAATPSGDEGTVSMEIDGNSVYLNADATDTGVVYALSDEESENPLVAYGPKVP